MYRWDSYIVIVFVEILGMSCWQLWITRWIRRLEI